LGPGQWDDWYAKWAAADIEQVTAAFRCLMDRDDITGRLGEINCPALMVHGSADAAIPLAKAHELRDGLAGPARLAVIEGCTHASNMSHPAEVSAKMLTFLRELDDTSPLSVAPDTHRTRSRQPFWPTRTPEYAAGRLTIGTAPPRAHTKVVFREPYDRYRRRRLSRDFELNTKTRARSAREP
jgi:hypothetical protein